MNTTKLQETVNKILKDYENDNNKVCILIDGKWGIGKTYTIEELKKTNTGIEYISVFGKKSVDQIEKELISKLRLKQLHECSGSDKFISVLKSMGSIANDVVTEKYNIDIKSAISPLIENLSIDSIKNDNNTIICIDDIERKSDDVNMIELLGLIERISTNFNIIIITNKNKIKENDFEKFEEFKEKIIDYEFTLDVVDIKIKKEIIRNKIKSIEEKNLQIILLAFNNSGIQSIRLYKKYVDLIYRLNKEINTILEKDEFYIDYKLSMVCIEVIKKNYLYYDKNGTDVSKIRHRYLDNIEERLCICVDKILKYDTFDRDILKDYFDYDREINQDIKGLNNLHRFSSKEEIINLIKKIYEKIELEDKNYFEKQIDVINIYNELFEIKIDGCEINSNIYDKLKKIAEELYKPSLEGFKQFESSYWDDIDIYTGTPIENNKLDNIIKDINQINLNKYNELIELEVKDAFEQEKYDKLKDLLANVRKLNISLKIDYKNMFSHLFKIIKYDETVFYCLVYIYLLIDEKGFLDTINSEDSIFEYRKQYLIKYVYEFCYFEQREKEYEQLEKEYS